MNEKLQYATMLEIPVSTCNVTFKNKKKSKSKKVRPLDAESVKQELLDKINSQEENQDLSKIQQEQEDFVCQEQADQEENAHADDSSMQSTAIVHACKVKPKKVRREFKVSIVGVQLAIIGVLVATIFLTNALYSDSGINVFLRGVFGNGEQVKVDDRVFNDFAPVISVGDSEITIDDGVMTLVGGGSVYSACNGKITSIVEQDGKFTIEITHSPNFKSVLSGVDYAYIGLEDKVYSNIPVGYVTTGVTMCFKSGDGSVISNYQIVGDAVVWAV